MAKRTNTLTNKQHPTTIKGIGQRKHQQQKRAPKVSFVGLPTELLRVISANLGPADVSHRFRGYKDQDRTERDMVENIVRRNQYEFSRDWLDAKVARAKTKILTYLGDIWHYVSNGLKAGLYCDEWYIGQTDNPRQRFGQHRRKWGATALVCVESSNYVYAANAIERCIIAAGEKIGISHPEYGEFRNKQIYRRFRIDQKRIDHKYRIYFYIAFKGTKIPEFLRERGVQNVYC